MAGDFATDRPDFGDFAVRGILGAGGTSTVYEATWGPRDAALKVLHDGLANDRRVVERFFDEGKKLAGVLHPHIVKVLGVGRLPSGQPYLAMELLRGETLAARVRRGRLPVEKAQRYFAQIASAVAHLHEQQIVHRDIKPENVIITDDDHAVLLDLGLAKPEDDQATLTQTGTIVGTPQYMAPERLFGTKANPSTDVYELALTLYVMLAGELPWRDDAEGRLNPTLLSEHGVNVSFEVPLMKALSTRVDKRPASVSAMAAAVSSALPPRGRSLRNLWFAGAAAMILGALTAVYFIGFRDDQRLPQAWQLHSEDVSSFIVINAPRFAVSEVIQPLREVIGLAAEKEGADAAALASGSACDKWLEGMGQVSVGARGERPVEVFVKPLWSRQQIEMCLGALLPRAVLRREKNITRVEGTSSPLALVWSRDEAFFAVVVPPLRGVTATQPRIDARNSLARDETWLASHDVSNEAGAWFLYDRNGTKSVAQVTLGDKLMIRVVTRYPSLAEASAAQAMTHAFVKAMPTVFQFDTSEPYFALFEAALDNRTEGQRHIIAFSLGRETVAMIAQQLKNRLQATS